jgi:hypothetical protein
LNCGAALVVRKGAAGQFYRRQCLRACSSHPDLRGIALRTEGNAIFDVRATLITGMFHWTSRYRRVEQRARKRRSAFGCRLPAKSRLACRVCVRKPSRW